MLFKAPLASVWHMVGAWQGLANFGTNLARAGAEAGSI
jgi:hypothetical protein